MFIHYWLLYIYIYIYIFIYIYLYIFIHYCSKCVALIDSWRNVSLSMHLLIVWGTDAEKMNCLHLLLWEVCRSHEVPDCVLTSSAQHHRFKGHSFSRSKSVWNFKLWPRCGPRNSAIASCSFFCLQTRRLNQFLFYSLYKFHNL